HARHKLHFQPLRYERHGDSASGVPVRYDSLRARQRSTFRAMDDAKIVGNLPAAKPLAAYKARLRAPFRRRLPCRPLACAQREDGINAKGNKGRVSLRSVGRTRWRVDAVEALLLR